MEKLTYTVKEFAEQMQVSLPTAYQFTNQEGFPVIRAGRKKLIPIEALRQWLADNAGRIYV